jgi:hypothetical protein
MTTVNRNWIAVAAADHVRRGREAGFMQVCHGKGAPLRRIRAGDRVAYYSPTIAFGGKEKCRAFTALGIVRAGAPYQAEMGQPGIGQPGLGQPGMDDRFHPFRRDVRWVAAHDASIEPLLDALEFTAGKRNWGYQFRFGLFAVSDCDMRIIAQAMGAEEPIVPAHDCSAT